MIHYVDSESWSKKEWNIVYTVCGKYWIDVYQITNDPKIVTCKKCREKIK